MSVQSLEARIILAIEAIRSNKKMSVRHAAKVYNIPEAFLRHRIKGRVARRETYNSRYKLTPTEEETLVRYILDLDTRGFPPRIVGVNDIADLLLATRRTKPTGKNWAQRFVQGRPELKTCLLRAYNKQRAFYEDSKLIDTWFRLVDNICAKYAI
jgi:hypothetical protein